MARSHQDENPDRFKDTSYAQFYADWVADPEPQPEPEPTQES